MGAGSTLEEKISRIRQSGTEKTSKIQMSIASQSDGACAQAPSQADESNLPERH